MSRFYRKVIRITAEDSPNVRLAMAQIKAGHEPTGEVLVPGVLPYADYVKRRETWDPVLQCIGLDGMFYEGGEVLLFPPLWLNHSEHLARSATRKRIAKAIGIDSAEGGDETSMTALDEIGLIEQVSRRTPDTNVIVGECLAFMEAHGVPACNVGFDRGGGGKEHADRLRAKGHMVRTIAFGEAVVMEPKRGLTTLEQKREVREEHYAYKTRRSQMYGEASVLMNPVDGGWAIPAEYTELRRQLSLIPKTYDEEGRLALLPKHRRDPKDKRPTLTGILGCSPDRADSMVLGIYVMQHRQVRKVAGAIR